MKEGVKDWLMQMSPVPGWLACGVRFNDQSALCRSFSREFPVVALEQSLRCVADTFRVLKVHRLPGARLRWVYAGADLHCVRRDDGTIFSVFVGADPTGTIRAEVDRVLSDFAALPAAV